MASGFAHGRITSLTMRLQMSVVERLLVLGSELQTAEQKVDHPNCLPLPVLARPNVRHARERAKQQRHHALLRRTLHGC